MSQKYQSFEEFWPYYVREHSKPATRIAHFVGTALIFPVIIIAILINLWLLFLVPVIGYGFAWISHLLIEKNRPATFTYPRWSLIGDFKMFFLILTGRMGREVERHCKQ
ncbi:DUF962 domain-containing protein [Rubellicoccus peritrichatus]|uniref:DUF962 domain-containing protein n=1 Tax=Rubellicoccus peritrichatus TaxID=3080537 RepID=A0AAQ3LBW5_9BACT|nr:DUF962 domain-containing protein [Puniceicoccus sp. CR14]WOO41709.1 DUF962 domain-containing protein [Puniceicoccus sp. CR14]